MMDKSEQDTLLLGTCSFDPVAFTLRDAAGVAVPLRSQSMRVLVELAGANGQVVSRDRLVDVVWSEVAVTDDSLIQCIKDIRAAIADTDRTIVKTVVGQGYALNARKASEPGNVLPRVFIDRFRWSSGSPVAEELSEALFEDLIVRLTPRAGIDVVTDPERRSEANYVISGRASERGGKARIFVRIERSPGHVEVHAGAEEAGGEAVWDLPGCVADKIAAQLRVQMIMGDGAEFVDRDDAELSSQELATKAAWHMARYRRENWYAATAALEAAVQRGPDNAVVLAMLASMHTQMVLHVPFDRLPEDVNRAMALAERAVELDQSIDWVLRTRGTLRLWRLGDHEGARLDCYRALEINPVFHLAHLTIAASEILSGELDAGSQRLQEMMRRVPRDSQNPFYFALIALAELLAGREAEAIKAAREGYERNPMGAWNALVFAAAGAKDARISGTDRFRQMARRISLPATHFRDMPFTDPAYAECLVSRAKTAGVNETNKNMPGLEHE